MQIEMVTLRQIVAKFVRKGVADETPDADSRFGGNLQYWQCNGVASTTHS